eukprot:scaffold15622_cov150-Amphora_coffeaeformis.AAC.2
MMKKAAVAAVAARLTTRSAADETKTKGRTRNTPSGAFFAFTRILLTMAIRTRRVIIITPKLRQLRRLLYPGAAGSSAIFTTPWVIPTDGGGPKCPASIPKRSPSHFFSTLLALHPPSHLVPFTKRPREIGWETVSHTRYSFCLLGETYTAVEMITATAWCGIIYALIGGQPMVRGLCGRYCCLCTFALA